LIEPKDNGPISYVCKVFSTPNFWVEINTQTLNELPRQHCPQWLCFTDAWVSSIQIFGFNVFRCNRHSLTMLQLTSFESISKSMDFNNLSCNTHKRKNLPIFRRVGFIFHTHYLMFVQFCFSTWYVKTTSTCKQTCACLYIYEIVKQILFNFES